MPRRSTFILRPTNQKHRDSHEKQNTQTQDSSPLHKPPSVSNSDAHSFSPGICSRGYSRRCARGVNGGGGGRGWGALLRARRRDVPADAAVRTKCRALPPPGQPGTGRVPETVMQPDRTLSRLRNRSGCFAEPLAARPDTFLGAAEPLPEFRKVFPRSKEALPESRIMFPRS